MSALQSVHVEGGIAPATLFQLIQSDKIDPAESRTPTSYHLVGRESIRDAANRSWTYLTGAWQAWREAQEREPGGMGSTNAGPTRERWLLVLLQELGYGRLTSHVGGLSVDEQGYPISHLWQHLPVHLLGPGVDLDRRSPGVAGAARAPQAMVQELLNRSDEHLWAILSNGRQLRLLRDSSALAGSAYIEFDLQSMFEGELFAEFLLLWQVCHQSRLEPRAGDEGEPTLAQCWLEIWRADAVKSGTRALEKLRGGVEDALEHLGAGFLAHAENRAIRDALASGALAGQDYHRHLLRLVYRLLFLFVTEDRDVLHPPGTTQRSRARYGYLSTQRLRSLARERHGSGSYSDLWHGQRLVLRALGGDGAPELGLPALGGLFDPEPGHGDPFLAAELPNDAFLAALRDLAWIRHGTEQLQPVDYRNLGAEELGGVYEALLELVPQVSVEDQTFTYERLSGNERKTTGSYYTPPGLVSALLDTALDPIIDNAVRGVADVADAERRLLALTVCDPACGSGHFLVAAARRIAQRLAALRSGEDEPTPADVRHALRDVVGRCIYGVDLNPLAAELAKVSLWLEAIEPGKALGFLDARIRVGNSLLGTTPALLASGVPDEAFKPLEGDDKATASSAKKRNARERGTFRQVQDQLDLDFSGADHRGLVEARSEFVIPRDDVAEIRDQARRWRSYEQSSDYLDRKLHGDAWVSAFVWPYVQPTKAEDGTTATPPNEPTSAVVRRFETEPDAPTLRATREVVEELVDEYRFFHWHLEFPEVFDRGGEQAGQEGWTGGFDAMLGNPPWERVKLQEQEFFAARDPEIATAPNAAARRRLIAALSSSESAADRALHREFRRARRRAAGESALLRTSGRFPLAGRGDVNTYAVFSELFRSLTGPAGQAGIMVPTGIATDATTQRFFKDLVQSRSLVALFDFENRAPLFESVDSRFKFCLLTLSGRDRRADAATFAFFLHDPSDIEASRFGLTPEEITLLNPNSGTLPIFRTRRDAEITLGIYRRVPALIKEGDPDGNPWGLSFMRMFDMSNDSGLFRTRDQLEADGWTLCGNIFEKHTPSGLTRMLPLYEAKMLHQYDNQWATYKRDGSTRDVQFVEKRDPEFAVMPRYWIVEREIDAQLAGRWDRSWLMGWRKLTNATNERTLVYYVFPRAGLGDSGNLVLSSRSDSWLIAPVANSFVVDYVARPKIGGTNFNFFQFAQLPVPTPKSLYVDVTWIGSKYAKWLECRFRELSGDLCWGGSTDPAWDEARRDLIRAELDAMTLHLYGVVREDAAHILETFPIVKRKDIATYGEYRTKRLILEVYDAMQHAIDTGTTYQTILDPPPGEGPRQAASSVEPDEAKA